MASSTTGRWCDVGHPEGIAAAERSSTLPGMIEPNLFALPPGVDFPAELVEGLLARMAASRPRRWRGSR
jgi:hypothetical protein